MRKEYLNKYLILMPGYDQSLDELRTLCQRVTEENGQDCVRLSLHVRYAKMRDAHHADIVVAICRNLTDRVQEECVAAANAGQVVLLCYIGRPGGDDWEMLRARISREETPGSIAWSIPRPDPMMFILSFLPRLHRATRLLDTRPPEQVSNPFVARFVRRLSSWPVLKRRLHHNEDLKGAAADFFLDRYMERLVSSGVSKLFFESGSSIAYLGERFLLRLNKEWVQRETQVLDLETNNILCLMEFIEAKGVRLHLYPDGPPETEYGATFGSIEKVRPERGRLGVKAREVVDEVKQHLADYQQYGIVFGAASGIDLKSKNPGPHVGSFQNMLLKRALLESGSPVVLFVDEEKLPYDFIPDRCFSVCDDEFTWEHVCKKIPLALACAFQSEARAKKTKVLAKLRRIGFKHQQTSRSTDIPWSVIVSNDAFWTRWELPDKS